MNNKTLKAINTSWSYIVNENGNAVRTTLMGYGSCTPIDVLQKYIDSLSKEQFKKQWQRCENNKDIID